MRQRYIQRDDGKLVLAEDYYADPVAPMVMGDIQPYTSMIDGSTISSRSHHRAHLKQHGCIEIGNETKYLQQKPAPLPDGRKELIVSQVQRMGHEGFKRAVKNDVDFIKWNSRNLPRG